MRIGKIISSRCRERRIDLYDFPAMLGPAEQWPEGSKNWAECLGNRLRYQTWMAHEHGVANLIPTVEKAVTTSPSPWDVWPEPPAATPDRYFLLCTGFGWEEVLGLITTYGMKEDYVRILRAMQAHAEVDVADSNKKGGGYLPYDIRKVSEKGRDGGDSKSYLLRRLARGHEAILAAYERGEFPSVRAAARAAGIIKPKPWPSLLQSVWRKAWPNMTEEEQDAFLREHGLKHDDCGGFHADDKG